MGAKVQVRLDEKTTAALRELVKKRGLTTSEILREGIHLVANKEQLPLSRRLIGVGCYDSGISDLATNKEHMKDFGRKSMGQGWVPPEERNRKSTSRKK